MRSTLCLSTLVLLCGCAKASLSSLVPRLDLRLAMERPASTSTLLGWRRSADLHATFSAVLRWRPRVEASQTPYPHELAPYLGIAPCAETDLECLREVAESESELRAALRDLP